LIIFKLDFAKAYDKVAWELVFKKKDVESSILLNGRIILHFQSKEV
jgi:hypothetical protein